MVTGASSGLGREMARDLAKRHSANLILVARRRERLEELKTELEQKYRVQARVISANLARREDVDRVFTEATGACDVQAVVLNAGITHFGQHHDLTWEEFENMLDTNVKSAVRFTHHFIPYLLGKDQGGAMMFVTSMAGLQPAPYQTAYSSTKAFLTSFGLGLHHELAGKNISITTFAPGGIATEMTESNGLAAHFGRSLQMQAAEFVAREAINALVQRRYLHVPGQFNRLQLFLPRLLPRRLVGSVVASSFQKALLARTPHA
ncbi:MAG TPA: SDR family NAD(P)-dependent oxidoreductase [Polyangiales bacterium]|nr:SDR family NAD(P)-dependent oxidoreductase [Polyangiales bacterium]